MNTQLSEVQQIGRLADAGEKMIERLRRSPSCRERRKSLNVRFGIAEVPSFWAVPPIGSVLRREERPPAPCPGDESGRRLGYDIETVLTMRKVLGASPSRSPDDDAAIIAIQNFKGGVGKSLSPATSPLPGGEGLSVLVIDCDSQATTTSIFGFNPDFDVSREHTLYPYLSIDPTQADLSTLSRAPVAERRSDPLQPRTLRRRM